MKTVGEIVKGYIAKGAKELYSVSGRYGRVFLSLANYANDEAPGRLTKTGFLYGFRKNETKYFIGEIVHSDFGWS